MTSAVFLAGLAAIVAGVALVSAPAGLIVAGLLTCAIAVRAHEPPAPPPQGGGDA